MTISSQTSCEHEGTEERLNVSDSLEHSYQLQLFENGSGWSAKVFDVDTLAGQIHCLNQGDALFLGDLHVLRAATRPIQGLARLRGWLGLPTRGRIENYRNRGLGSALLNLVINRARAHGFRRVIGRLAPIDLKEDPKLPDWYRRRGFQIAVASNRLTGDLELVLSGPD